MSKILQGTTPSMRIRIKETDFSIDDVIQLELRVWQDSKTFDKTYSLDDVTKDAELNAFVISFTEEETLSMTSSSSIRWQMRCKLTDGNIVGTVISQPISIAVLKSQVAM